MRVWALCAFILGVLNDPTTATAVEQAGDVNLHTYEIINTEIGKTIDLYVTKTYPSCHIKTPDGVTVDFGKSHNIAGVQLLLKYDTCVARITVSEDAIGLWTLIARRTLENSDVYERISSYQVVVERQVQTFPQNAVAIKELSDFYIRLLEPTDLHDTCQLVSPSVAGNSRIKPDPNFKEFCAYVVSEVTTTDSGKWEITYGNRIQYKASVTLTVTASIPQVPQELHLVDQSAVNVEVGPENAVYCQLQNPRWVVTFDGFGRCVLNIGRVSLADDGQWRMFVSLPGKVVAEMFILTVQVVQNEPKPQVKMSVSMSKEDPSLTLSCSVETSSAARVCKFRDPHEQILNAQAGIGEGRYTFQGTGASSNGTDKHFMDCGLRIASPTTDDLGIWRCAVETELDTYYGFHLAVCPWLLNSGSLPPSVKTVPTLKGRQGSVVAKSGDRVEMMCTIPAAIRYCYFRSSNGTVLTMSPGKSSDVFDYVGNGFEAGECGIRLNHITTSATGQWSCHAGIVTDNALSEQFYTIQMYIQELFVARLNQTRNGVLRLYATVNTNSRTLDYCRFVRNDGWGFTNELMPDGYEFKGSLSSGWCEMLILRPEAEDFRSWTVATRLQGQQHEYVATTAALRNNSSSNSSFFVVRLTLLVICIGLLCLSLGLLFSSKERRRWTYARATAVRDSVRRSLRFRKPPPVVPPASANVTTSQAA